MSFSVSPTLKFTFDDTNWMKASVSASLMKPRLHVSPSRWDLDTWLNKSLIVSRSRRQRRPSVHVAQTFEEAAWRPWPSSWASTSAWRHRISSLSPAEVVYTLRRFFFVIRCVVNQWKAVVYLIANYFPQLLTSPSSVRIGSELLLPHRNCFGFQLCVPLS